MSTGSIRAGTHDILETEKDDDRDDDGDSGGVVAGVAGATERCAGSFGCCMSCCNRERAAVNFVQFRNERR